MEPENLEEMKQWLQHNNSPIPKVVEFMKKTALKRQEEIHSEKKSTVHDIELQWPRLFDVPNMVWGNFCFLGLCQKYSKALILEVCFSKTQIKFLIDLFCLPGPVTKVYQILPVFIRYY